jgi:hypothetical protein
VWRPRVGDRGSGANRALGGGGLDRRARCASVAAYVELAVPQSLVFDSASSVFGHLKLAQPV